MKLLTKTDVASTLKLSIRCLENMVTAGEFPQGERVGRRVYWAEAAVSRWYETRFAAQEQWRPIQRYDR